MPDTLSAPHLTDDATVFPVVLNDRWRVVDDPLQWILQYRAGNVSAGAKSKKSSGWVGKRFCRTAAALKRDIGELCSEVDPVSLAIIDTWPEWHA